MLKKGQNNYRNKSLIIVTQVNFRDYSATLTNAIVHASVKFLLFVHHNITYNAVS